MGAQEKRKRHQPAYLSSELPDIKIQGRSNVFQEHFAAPLRSIIGNADNSKAGATDFRGGLRHSQKKSMFVGVSGTLTPYPHQIYLVALQRLY